MAQRKTLAGRIFAVFFAISLVVMVAATVAATAASYSVYESEAEQLLLSQADTYAGTLKELDSQDAMCASLNALPLVDTRCTLIADDGTVLFDNYADPSTMDNHANREEVVDAKKSGDVAVMRHSKTLNTNTLYAATVVRDGIVLRLAETRTSLVSFLGGMGWQLVISLIVIILLSVLVSRLLTSMIVRPLHEIDLSHPMENKAYSELQPLLQRVDLQRSELEQSMNIRHEFTANVSHEMKTPLQVIGGYAELMEAGIVPPEDVAKFSGLIHSESESMRVLIDDVLTLSRLDEHGAGQMVPVNLADVCHVVRSRLISSAEARGENIELDLDSDAIILGEPTLAEQMVYNLTSNAIKYNKDAGRVRMSVALSQGKAVLAVADEGPGIPLHLRERIFERFYRMEESRSRDTGGTGLGLAIVKHAAESFGGSVRVGTSNWGGAEFTITMPAYSIQD